MSLGGFAFFNDSISVLKTVQLCYHYCYPASGNQFNNVALVLVMHCHVCAKATIHYKCLNSETFES